MRAKGRYEELQEHYRSSVSAAVVAKAQYLALHGETSVAAVTLERAVARWRRLEAHKHIVAARLAARRAAHAAKCAGSSMEPAGSRAPDQLPLLDST